MNRVILTVIIMAVMVIWFSAMANACSPARAAGGGFFGPSWGLPIFIGGGGGGGWNQGGWDRGGSSSSQSKPSSPAPSRSSGGSTRGGGISGGSGGK